MSERLEELLMQWMRSHHVSLMTILHLLLMVAIEARRRMITEMRREG